MQLRRSLLTLVALGAAACGSDSAGINPAPRPDSGVEQTADGSLVDAKDASDASQAADALDGVDANETSDGASDGPPVVPALSFATYNVHQLFDTTCDSGNCAAGDFEMLPSQQQFDARIAQVSQAIRGLKSTVVALQEIETQGCMDALSVQLSDLYPTAIFAETGAAGSLDVAVFSAGKLLEIRKHRGEPITRPDGTSTWFSREFLEVHLALKGVRVIVFSAHFRSKSNDDPGRRQAEANAARDIVIKSAQLFPDAVVLMGGDLNDTPGSAPIAALESSSAMLRVASDMPNDQVATYFWNGQAQAIDHIFLETDSRGAYVAGSAAALRAGPQQGLGGSDHAALRAEFGLR